MRLLLVGLLFAASSAAADVPAAPNRQAAPPPPQSIWKSDGAGAFEHLQSGLICPPLATGYRRTRTEVFDAVGLDVGCNYATATSDITVYLTRRTGAGLDAALAEAKRELLQLGEAKHPQLISETRSTEDGLDWTTTLYGEDAGLHTSIWIADLSGWTLEYRATYAAADEFRVLADIRHFTGLVRETAGARLALCARAAPPQREGSAILDKQDLEQSSIMTSLLGGAALAHAQDGGGRKEPPTIWCVEKPVVAADRHMLFWRGVGPDGVDARVDQITLATDGPPPALVVAPDDLAGLVGDLAKRGDKSGNHAAHWTATIQTDDQVLIFGYFNGRPPVEAVSDLFARIVTGNAKSLGGYGVKGKAITITMPDGK